MKKKILGIVLALICVLSCGLAVVGCGSALSSDQLNTVLTNSANAFYGSHRTVDNYADSTYHWTQTMTTKQKEELTYKLEGSENDFRTELVENTTVETSEYTVAIKSVDDHLVSEINVVKTTVRKGAELDGDQHFKEVNETTVETENYRMLYYKEGAVDKNILLMETTKTVNGDVDNISQLKQYYSYNSMSDYDNFCRNSVIGRLNERIADIFFQTSGEMMIYYKDIFSAEKNGNQVKLSGEMTMVDVSSSYDWHAIKITGKQDSYFKDDKIWKADYSVNTYGENIISMEETITFDYAENASVNTNIPNLEGYSQSNSNTWSSAVSYLPKISIMGSTN